MADRTIWGCVNADGTLHSATPGVEVAHEGPGLYTVRFGVEFETAPAVALTQNYPGWDDFASEGGNTRDNAVLVAADAERCRVATGDKNGARVDRNFTFIAVGSIGYRSKRTATQALRAAAKAVGGDDEPRAPRRKSPGRKKSA